MRRHGHKPMQILPLSKENLVASNISVTVVSAKCVQGTSYVPHYYHSADPVYLEVSGTVDGVMVYFKVNVAEKFSFDAGGGGHIRGYRHSSTEVDNHRNGGATWTMPMSDVNIASGYNVAVATIGSFPVPAIWRDDVVEIRGTIEEKVSKAGNRYMQASRVKLVSVTREGVKV